MIIVQSLMNEAKQRSLLPWEQEVLGLHSRAIEAEKNLAGVKKTLGKAEVALLNWNPKDGWFPEIEMQYCELMDEINSQLALTAPQ